MLDRDGRRDVVPVGEPGAVSDRGQSVAARQRASRPAVARGSEGAAGAVRCGTRRRGEGIRALPENVDRLWARAEQQLPTWQTVTMRLPERPRAPVSFTMNDARHWNAFARSQLALDAATGDIVRWEPYAEQSRGQKWRGWVRFGHTGELGGIAGQALAGIAVPRRSGPRLDGPGARVPPAPGLAALAPAGGPGTGGVAAGSCSDARMNTKPARRVRAKIGR